jgi:hypothetical protein
VGAYPQRVARRLVARVVPVVVEPAAIQVAVARALEGQGAADLAEVVQLAAVATRQAGIVAVAQGEVIQAAVRWGVEAAPVEKVRAAVVRVGMGVAANRLVARQEAPVARAVGQQAAALQAEGRPVQAVALEAVRRRTTPVQRRRVG